MYRIKPYLKANVIDFKLSQQEIRISCPFCDDSSFHLYINEQKNLFHCFKCDEAGAIAKLLDKLNETYNSSVVLEEVEDEPEEAVESPEVKLPAGYQSVFEDGVGVKEAYQYLRSRNISDSEIKFNKIGYTHFGRFAGRVIFPVYYQGKLVSYIGRSIHTSLQPKVLNPHSTEAPSPAKFLYNFDQAKYFPGLILTEGVFSCLSTPIVDYHYAPVATFGKKLSIEQKRLIFSQGFKEVIFAWDKDAMGEILKCAVNFTPFFNVKVVWFSDDKDPNDLGPQVMTDLVRDAIPFNTLSSLKQISANISLLAKAYIPIL